MQNDVTIVVQARTNSARFPGKALVDFLGLPVAVLAAKRAGSRGHRVVLATSLESSDNALAEVAARHGIACHRGSLNDVLGRFVGALEGCRDDEIVVRLTADNIVPDGDLIAEVVSDFKTRDLNYLTTTDTASGLPYGCSIEVTRVGLIRQAASEASSAFEREHVMPWIRARNKVTVFTGRAEIGRGHFRCTIDCLDDYISLIGAFPRNCDPVAVGWGKVIASLKPGYGQPITSRPIKKLVLGTAQFGMPYGIVRTNEPDEAESMMMIKQAILSGVNWLDTARAYGRSESVVGKVLASGWAGRTRVVTKLSPMPDCAADADPKLAATMAENSLFSSCVALQCTTLDTVLLHRAEHLRMWNGSVFDVLKRWRNEGLLGTIGVSVQTPEELMMALENSEIEHIQVPFNILDYRWSQTLHAVQSARADRRLVVHARSAFLQGLLLSDNSEAWARAHVRHPKPILSWLASQVGAMGYRDAADLCLAFVRSQDWIDGIVVGLDRLAQLRQAIESFSRPLLEKHQLKTLTQTKPFLSPRSLDPSQWSREPEAST